MSPEGPVHNSKAVAKVAKEICKSQSHHDRECSERQLRVAKNYDSESYAANSNPRAPRFHRMPCLPCNEPFKSGTQNFGAHTRKLRNPSGALGRFERHHRHGSRSTRIPAHRESCVLAALH